MPHVTQSEATNHFWTFQGPTHGSDALAFIDIQALSPEFLHPHKLVQTTRDFLHLQRRVAHPVLPLHETISGHALGTGSNDIKNWNKEVCFYLPPLVLDYQALPHEPGFAISRWKLNTSLVGGSLSERLSFSKRATQAASRESSIVPYMRQKNVSADGITALSRVLSPVALC